MTLSAPQRGLLEWRQAAQGSGCLEQSQSRGSPLVSLTLPLLGDVAGEKGCVLVNS